MIGPKEAFQSFQSGSRPLIETWKTSRRSVSSRFTRISPIP